LSECTALDDAPSAWSRRYSAVRLGWWRTAGYRRGHALHAGGEERGIEAPEAMDIYTFLIQLLNGVQYGLLLFLVASG
jgi:hypothetical protein